jgi:hypothetical protein
MTVSDWGASFKFKSDFIMLFEKINNFINLNSIIFSKKGIKISARSNNENLEIIFDKGKKKNKIISFSFYYKTREEICIKEYDWRDISSNIKTTSSCKLINVNFFDISNKVESIDFFLEKLNQVN